MRKHFLILMLLSLLPLAGFAADISKGTIVVPSPFYGQSPVVANIKVYNEANAELTRDTDYTFDGFFSDQSCTQSLTATQVAAKTVGTTMYVHVTGINGYENELIGTFEVKPMELTVTVNDASKTYLGNDPAFVIASVKLADDAEAPTAVKNDIEVTREDGKNAGTYAYKAKMKTNNNYIVKTVNGTFTINPKGFVKGTDVLITVTANLTYNGAAQEATIEVKDKATNEVLVKNTDYTITWTNNTNAGVATAQATIKGKGNYKTTDSNDEFFTIKEAPLLVTPSANKVYDGTAVLPADVAYAYQGFVDAKTADDVTVLAPVNEVTAGSANVGTYKLNTTDATQFTLVNYTFIPVEGEFEITKKTVTVTADNDLLHEYGTPEAFTWTKDGTTYVAADNAALNNAIKIVKGATPNAAGEFTLTPAFKSDEEISATTGLTTAQKNAAKQAVKNYTLNAVNGKLTYDAAPLQIALKESAYTLTKVYDGQPVSIDLDKTNGVTIIGLKGDDAVNTDNLELEVVENSANVGTYQLKLSGAVAPNYNITYIPSQYKITQKDLKVTAYKQVFIKGKALNLNTELYTIDAAKGLVDGDKANEVFKLTTTVTKDAGGNVTSDAGDYAINIEDVATATSKWGNYNVTTVAGLAKVYNDAILLDDTKDLQTVVTSNTNDAVVSFTKRTLNVEQWNVLVLPFEVSVKDLAAAFDYAVVDVLDQTASDGNVHFKLKVTGTIAANTPFLIYPSDANNNLNQIVFEGVNVKKINKPTVEVKDAGGNKFVGTYQTTGIYGESFRYMSQGTWYNTAKYTETNKCNIKPLRGYLDLSGSTAAAPVIFIEEPNGDVTAIGTVTTKTSVAIENDGWYTLNGVKLQNAPTKKGIYVRNGKKVVIK